MEIFKTMPEISIVLPCRNEEKGIGFSIKEIKKVLKGKDYEIIVSDSSSDKSAEVARQLGAKVVKHKEGYGDALITGLDAANGEFLVFADCDCSYDFGELPKFISALREYDFVMGSRFKGVIKKGAMPFLHKYIGNPALTYIFNRKFKTSFSDTHSGFRGMTKKAFDKMDLGCKGMEFASEMLAEAARLKLKVKEVTIGYSKRIGRSKLHSFRDGFRHLRFMLTRR